MGIGKTTIAIAAHHVQHIMNIMHNDIRKTPLLHAGPADNLDTACQSNEQVVKKYEFDCPCATLSPTYGIKANRGICVVLLLLGLLKNQCDEWKKCYSDNNGEITDVSNPLKMSLVLGHRSAKAADGNFMTFDKKRLMQSGEIAQGED